MVIDSGKTSDGAECKRNAKVSRKVYQDIGSYTQIVIFILIIFLIRVIVIYSMVKWIEWEKGAL